MLRTIGSLFGGRAAGAAGEAALPLPAPEQLGYLASAPVHVMRQDGLVSLVDGHLALGAAGERPELVRLDEVSQVSLFGTAGITAPCLAALMKRGIPVIFRSAGGFYLGQTADLSGVSTAVRRAHYRVADDKGRSLVLARTLVKAKIVNQRGALRRHEAGANALPALARLASEAAAATDAKSLIGIEGAAAAAYYAALPEMISAARREAFRWDGRRRRPPADPVNCLLSYLYVVLAGECGAAALAAGLDPAVGFLHAEVPGRPALALDLMEPFRPLIADAAALAAVNRGVIKPEHFTAKGDGAVSLTDAGRRIVIEALERRWAEPVPSRAVGAEGKTNWRQAVHAHARRLAKALVAGAAFSSFERG